MKSRKLVHLTVTVGLILLSLLANLIGLTEATSASAAEATNSLDAAKTTTTTNLQNPVPPPSIFSIDSEPALPAAVPPNRPLLQASPVLTLTKTADPDPAVAGDTLVYTIEVTDDPMSGVTGVVISDVLDSNVDYVSSDGGSHASGVVTWNIVGGIAAGETITRIVTVTVKQVDIGTLLTNTASVTSTEGASDSDTIQTTVNAEADLSISKDNGQDETVPGEQTPYTIIVSNPSGPSIITGATVTDNFSTKLTGISWTCSGSGGGSCTANGSNNIHDTVNLPVGGSVTYLVTGTVLANATGQLTNTASVTVPSGATDPVPDNNSATDTDTLTPRADLSISKDNGQDETVPGEQTPYTIIVSNPSGPSIITGATVTDNFSTKLTGISWTCSGSGGGSCTANGSNNIHDTVNLPVGGSVTYLVTGTVLANATGQLTNTASVTVPSGATDPVPDNNSATDTDTLTPRADLSISKDNGQDETVPGEQTPYTIIVSNPSGPSIITGATVTDNFSTKLTGISWTCSGSGGGSCTANGSNNIHDTVNLPVGGSVTYLVTGTVLANATGQLTNTASVTVPSGATDPVPDNNSATDTDTLTPRADLSISKDNGQDETVPGEQTPYTIIVSNPSGPSIITGATVTDNFSTKLTGISWTCSGSGGGSCTANGSNNIHDTVNLPVGGSVTYLVTGTVLANATGQLTNTASVTVPSGATDPVPDNNSATDTDTLTPRADLSISKDNGQDETVPGEQTPYTIIVSNPSGPSVITGATVTDNFSTKLTGISWTCSGSGGGSCTANGSNNIHDTVNLPVGGSVTYLVTGTVLANATGQLTNTASVTVPSGATDPVPDNNSATDTDTLTPVADLRVTKTDSPGTVIAGNILTYYITVYNDGPSDATEVTLVDNLPPGVTFQSSTPGSPTCNHVAGNVTCDLNTIASGNNVLVTLAVIVDPSHPGGTLINQAVVDNIAEPDPNVGNDADNELTSVIVRTDLAITKSDSSDPTLLGKPLTYTLNIVNNGPSNATGVQVIDNLPGNVSFVSAQSTLGSCSGTSTVTCNLGAINSGATAVVRIVVNPLGTGLLSNSADVTGDQTDPDTGNNSDGEATTVNAEADLAVNMIATPNPVVPGKNLTYTITVTNNGPSGAINVSLTDTLPSGVTHVSTTPSQGSCNGTSTINCSLGNLARNSNATVEIIVNVNESAAGNLTNTVTVSSNIIDPISNNDSEIINTLVGGFKMVFLPIVAKPQPTELWVYNDHTGENATFIVRELGTSAEVTRCTVGNNQTKPCDHDSDGSNIFPPGTYKIEVTAVCGSNTFNKTYDSGPQTTRVFCN